MPKGMHRILWSYIPFLLGIYLLLSCHSLPEVSLEQHLSSLPGVQVKPIPSLPGSGESYEILIRQPLDHRNPHLGDFLQRIYLTHRDSTLPMVLVTEGYDAEENYRHEITDILAGNQIIVEHRFFGRSVPDSMAWDKLDAWQAATDQHRIIGLFNSYYTGKWISTGISKGGQTAIFHRYYYPRDVDITVPYVAPVNFSPADLRVDSFLARVGTVGCRVHIRDFQQLVLKHRDILFSLFRVDTRLKQLSFHRTGEEAAFEYVLLEYPFAFWQYGRAGCQDIPVDMEDTLSVYRHLVRVSDPAFFSDEGLKKLEPFFYQAMTETGFYRYDTAAFHGQLKYIQDPTFRFAAPAGTELVFREEFMQKVDRFIRKRSRYFIFLYGEYDAWSATAAEFPVNKRRMKIVKEKGFHDTRIRNLPEDQQERVISALRSWTR